MIVFPALMVGAHLIITVADPIPNLDVRPSCRAAAPVVPVPKNGSSTTSPGLVEDRSTRCKRDSGFWVGCSLPP